MDSIKTLMERKQYELVIRLTETSTDYNSLFYRISALLASGYSEDALECLRKNRRELQKKLALLIKVHIEILCILQMFDEAYEEMEYYENLPYESQEVEEALRFYRKYIRDAEKDSVCSKELNDEQIIERLSSSKPALVLDGLQAIREKDYTKFLVQIKKILMNEALQSVRSFALMLLVEKKYNESVQFNHLGTIIDINPSLLEPPFTNKQFIDFIKVIQTDFKNPTLSQNAINLYSSYLIFIYPDLPKYDENEMICALYGLSKEFLQAKDIETFEEKCLKKNIDVLKARELMEKIKESIEVI